jgi:hypothetical protein
MIQLASGYIIPSAGLCIAFDETVSAQFFEYCYRLRKFP